MLGSARGSGPYIQELPVHSLHLLLNLASRLVWWASAALGDSSVRAGNPIGKAIEMEQALDVAWQQASGGGQ